MPLCTPRSVKDAQINISIKKKPNGKQISSSVMLPVHRIIAGLVYDKSGRSQAEAEPVGLLPTGH